MTVKSSLYLVVQKKLDIDGNELGIAGAMF